MSEATDNFKRENEEIKMIMQMYKEMDKARERILNLFEKHGYDPSIFSYALTIVLEVNGTSIILRDGNKPTIDEILTNYGLG